MMEQLKKQTRKTIVAIAGAMVVVAGIIMIPYPGPGWLVVFAGLAILSTEFTWARRVLEFAKMHYDRWQQWLKRQPLPIRLLALLFTAAVVVATLWLLNVFGMFGDFLHLNLPVIKSPFA